MYFYIVFFLTEVELNLVINLCAEIRWISIVDR